MQKMPINAPAKSLSCSEKCNKWKFCFVYNLKKNSFRFADCAVLVCTLQRILGKSVANNEKFYRVVSEPEPY